LQRLWWPGVPMCSACVVTSRGCFPARRADDTARLNTARSDWERRALAAQAEAVALQQQLAVAKQQLGEGAGQE
jgi:hypothetical protein